MKIPLTSIYVAAVAATFSIYTGVPGVELRQEPVTTEAGTQE